MPGPMIRVDPGLYPYCTPIQKERLEAIAHHGGIRAAAKALGFNSGTLLDALKAVEKKAAIHGYRPTHDLTHVRDIREELHIPTPPSGSEPIEDLVARKRAQHDRMRRLDDFHRLIPITVRHSGPVAICAVGDPHVDSDHCDIAAIERDMSIIGKTPGAYALHLGDITDNWVGNLARLYAHSSTKASDGVRLAEWMFSLAPPLAVVGGNHDCFGDGMTWLSFVLKQAGNDPILREHGVRMELRFPKGDPIRIHARHDFPGHSQFNPLHGLRREHLFGLRDHVNIAGHKHVDSAAVVPSPDGYMQWMIRVSGYKAHDDYAKKLNLAPMKMAPTVGLLINPLARVPAEVLKPYWCLEEMADVLGFMRRRG